MKISYENFNNLISQGKTTAQIKALIDSPLSEADIMSMSGGAQPGIVQAGQYHPPSESGIAWGTIKNDAAGVMPMAGGWAGYELGGPLGGAAGQAAGQLGKQALTGTLPHSWSEAGSTLGPAAMTGFQLGVVNRFLGAGLKAGALGLRGAAQGMREKAADVAEARTRGPLGAAMPVERRMARDVSQEVTQGLATAEQRRFAAGQAVAAHLQGQAPNVAPITFGEYVDEVANIMEGRKGMEYSPTRRRAMARDVAEHLAEEFNTNSGNLVKLKLPRRPPAPASSGLLDASGMPAPAPRRPSAPLPDWSFDLNQANLGKQIFQDAKLAAYDARRAGRALPHAGLNDAMTEAWRNLIEERVPTVAPLNAEYGKANEVYRRMKRMSNRQPSEIEQAITATQAQKMGAAREEEAARMARASALSPEAPAGVSLHVGFPVGVNIPPPKLPAAADAIAAGLHHPATYLTLNAILRGLGSYFLNNQSPNPYAP